MFFSRMSTHEYLHHSVVQAERRVVEATAKDAAKYDKDMARVVRRSEKRIGKIEKYEGYAETLREALSQYEKISQQYAAKHHPDVQTMQQPAAAAV